MYENVFHRFHKEPFPTLPHFAYVKGMYVGEPPLAQAMLVLGKLGMKLENI